MFSHVDGPPFSDWFSRRHCQAVVEGPRIRCLPLRFRDRISTASQGKEIINVYNCLLTFLYRLGDVSNHFEVCVFSYFSVVSCSFAFLHRFSFMIFSTSLQATFFFYSTGLLLARDIEAGSVLKGCDWGGKWINELNQLHGLRGSFSIVSTPTFGSKH